MDQTNDMHPIHCLHRLLCMGNYGFVCSKREYWLANWWSQGLA